MSRNGLRVGQSVQVHGFPHVGTIREFGGEATKYRGTSYRAAKVEWADGTYDWLSSIDLHASL